MPGRLRRVSIGWRSGFARWAPACPASDPGRRDRARRRVAGCLLALLGLGIGFLSPAAQGEAERSIDRLVEKLVPDLKRRSKVVVRPLALAHTGLPDSVTDRIEPLVVGALKTKIQRDMEVTLVTGKDVAEIFRNLEESAFSGGSDRLLESVLRSTRADAVVACEAFDIGADLSHFDIRCRATYARIVCPGGGDIGSCPDVEVRDIGNQGEGTARVPYRSGNEYLDHVFSDLAWKLAGDAALGGRDALEVVRRAGDSLRNAHFETFVSSNLREKIARAGLERLGPRVIEGDGGRRLKLVWSVVPFGDSYWLTFNLHEEGVGVPFVRNAKVAVAAIPESMRPSDGEVAAGGGTERGTGTGEGEASLRSPFGGQAILVVDSEPPGASVVVGGDRIGETPLTRADLRAGSWSVVLDHPWHETVRLEAQVLEDLKVLRIERRLVRASGTATVLLEQPVAGAWVEHGTKRREVPVSLDGLPVGPVVLTLGAPGHHDLRVEVEVPKEGVAMVRRRLEPVRHGTLTVTAVPADARVEVEGAGPYRAGMRLPLGSYRVRVSREGYLASETEVEVTGDSTLRVVLERESHAFTVVAEPREAEVRLLDVGKRYRPGMALPPGTYRVRVSAAGWEARVATVEHGRSATRHVVRLRRPPPSPEEVERGLSLGRSDRVLVQEGLASFGFDVGFADGVFGRRTRDAIRSYQRTKGLAETGYLTRELFEALAALAAVSKPRWEPGKKFRDCAGCPELVVVSSRSYEMGSPSGEEGRYADEGPQHRVRISESFAVGVFEVTRGEWGRFVVATGHSAGDSCVTYEGGEWGERSGRSWRAPGYGQGDGHPVVCVSSEDARAYVGWLSGETGEEYRLLSESEWEYVARAGTRTSRYWGDGESGQCRYANGADWSLKRRYNDWKWSVATCDDGHAHTAPVGSFGANGFGLHDVMGNVWEWVEDCWHDSYRGAPSDGRAWTIGGDCDFRVLRGGSWLNGAGLLRSAVPLQGHHRGPAQRQRFPSCQDAGLILAPSPLRLLCGGPGGGAPWSISPARRRSPGRNRARALTSRCGRFRLSGCTRWSRRDTTAGIRGLVYTRMHSRTLACTGDRPCPRS